METEEELILRAVRRINGIILGIVCGLVCGLGIFIATLWLVIKGGEVVGPHLSLLANYFIGYSVTVAGSFVGLAYGCTLGFVVGWFIARVYNAVVSAKSTD